MAQKLELVVAGDDVLGKILGRWVRATAGPWVIRMDSMGKIRIRSAHHPRAKAIAQVADSVAENDEFIAHSWADMKTLLGTTMAMREILRDMIDRIRKCPQLEPEDDGKAIYHLGITEEYLRHIEGMAGL